MQTLAIDWTRCDGHGLCRALLPKRIELDEWGYPILRERAVTPDDTGDVRRAVAACPALALSLREAPVSAAGAPRAAAATP